jgi:hypothetical protein
MLAADTLVLREGVVDTVAAEVLDVVALLLSDGVRVRVRVRVRVGVTVGVTVGVGLSPPHALAVAAKTRPAALIETSVVSTTTMGAPHEPDHVVVTLPDPDVDAMMLPDGEEPDVMKGPSTPS